MKRIILLLSLMAVPAKGMYFELAPNRYTEEYGGPKLKELAIRVNDHGLPIIQQSFEEDLPAEKLPAIHKLYVDDQRISYLPTEWFIQLRDSLQHLTISQANIESFHLSDLPNLEELTLGASSSGKSLRFVTLQNIGVKKLYLQNDNIEKLHLTDLPGLNQLTIDGYSYCRRLTHIFLQNVALMAFEAKHIPLHLLEVGSMTQLKSATIKNAQDLQLSLVGVLASLSSLNVSKSGLQRMPDFATHTPNLEGLDISYNPELRGSLDNLPPKLETLNISFCNFRNIDPLPSTVQTLYAQHNQLTTVPIPARSSAPAQTVHNGNGKLHIDVSGNCIHCDQKSLAMNLPPNAYVDARGNPLAAVLCKDKDRIDSQEYTNPTSTSNDKPAAKIILSLSNYDALNWYLHHERRIHIQHRDLEKHLNAFGLTLISADGICANLERNRPTQIFTKGSRHTQERLYVVLLANNLRAWPLVYKRDWFGWGPKNYNAARTLIDSAYYKNEQPLTSWWHIFPYDPPSEDQ